VVLELREITRDQAAVEMYGVVDLQRTLLHNGAYQGEAAVLVPPASLVEIRVGDKEGRADCHRSSITLGGHEHYSVSQQSREHGGAIFLGRTEADSLPPNRTAVAETWHLADAHTRPSPRSPLIAVATFILPDSCVRSRPDSKSPFKGSGPHGRRANSFRI
jgi:hypothetical protein